MENLEKHTMKLLSLELSVIPTRKKGSATIYIKLGTKQITINLQSLINLINLTEDVNINPHVNIVNLCKYLNQVYELGLPFGEIDPKSLQQNKSKNDIFEDESNPKLKDLAEYISQREYVHYEKLISTYNEYLQKIRSMTYDQAQEITSQALNNPDSSIDNKYYQLLLYLISLDKKTFSAVTRSIDCYLKGIPVYKILIRNEKEDKDCNIERKNLLVMEDIKKILSTVTKYQEEISKIATCNIQIRQNFKDLSAIYKKWYNDNAPINSISKQQIDNLIIKDAKLREERIQKLNKLQTLLKISYNRLKNNCNLKDRLNSITEKMSIVKDELKQYNNSSSLFDLLDELKKEKGMRIRKLPNEDKLNTSFENFLDTSIDNNVNMNELFMKQLHEEIQKIDDYRLNDINLQEKRKILDLKERLEKYEDAVKQKAHLLDLQKQQQLENIQTVDNITEIVNYFDKYHKRLISKNDNIYSKILGGPISFNDRKKVVAMFKENKSKSKLSSIKEKKDDLNESFYEETIQDKTVTTPKIYSGKTPSGNKIIVDETFNDLELLKIQTKLLTISPLGVKRNYAAAFQKRQIEKAIMMKCCVNLRIRRGNLKVAEYTSYPQYLFEIIVDFLIGKHIPYSEIFELAKDPEEKEKKYLEKRKKYINRNFDLHFFTKDDEIESKKLLNKIEKKAGDTFVEYDLTKDTMKKDARTIQNNKNRGMKNRSTQQVIIPEITIQRQRNLEQERIDREESILKSVPRNFKDLTDLGVEDYYECDYYYILWDECKRRNNEVSFLELRTQPMFGGHDAFTAFIYEMAEEDNNKCTDNEFKFFYEAQKINSSHKYIMDKYIGEFGNAFKSVTMRAFNYCKNFERRLDLLFYYIAFLNTSYKAQMSVYGPVVGQKKTQFEFAAIKLARIPIDLEIKKMMMKLYSNLSMDDMYKYYDNFDLFVKTLQPQAEKLLKEEQEEIIEEEKSEEEQEEKENNEEEKKENEKESKPEEEEKKNEEENNSNNENPEKKKNNAAQVINRNFIIYLYKKRAKTAALENNKRRILNDSSARSDYYGETIYNMIVGMFEVKMDLAAKISGMILEKNDEEIESIINNKMKLIETVNEASNLLVDQKIFDVKPYLKDTDNYAMLKTMFNRSSQNITVRQDDEFVITTRFEYQIQKVNNIDIVKGKIENNCLDKSVKYLKDVEPKKISNYIPIYNSYDKKNKKKKVQVESKKEEINIKTIIPKSEEPEIQIVKQDKPLNIEKEIPETIQQYKKLTVSEKFNLLPEELRKDIYDDYQYITNIQLTNPKQNEKLQHEVQNYVRYLEVAVAIKNKVISKRINYKEFLSDKFGNPRTEQYWRDVANLRRNNIIRILHNNNIILPPEINYTIRINSKKMILGYLPFLNRVKNDPKKIEKAVSKQSDIKIEKKKLKIEESISKKEEILKQLESNNEDVYTENLKPEEKTSITNNLKKEIDDLQEKCIKVKVNNFDANTYIQFYKLKEEFDEVVHYELQAMTLEDDYKKQFDELLVKYDEARKKNFIVDETNIPSTSEVLKLRCFLDKWQITRSNEILIRGVKSNIIENGRIVTGYKLLPNIQGCKRQKILFTTSSYPISYLCFTNLLYSAYVQTVCRFGSMFSIFVLDKDDNNKDYKDLQKYLELFNLSGFDSFEEYMFNMHCKILIKEGQIYDPMTRYYYYINTNLQTQQLLTSKEKYNTKEQNVNSFSQILCTYFKNLKINNQEVHYVEGIIQFIFKRMRNEIDEEFEFPYIEIAQQQGKNVIGNERKPRFVRNVKHEMIHKSPYNRENVFKLVRKESKKHYRKSSNSQRHTNYLKARRSISKDKPDDYYMSLIFNSEMNKSTQINVQPTNLLQNRKKFRKKKRNTGLNGAGLNKFNIKNYNERVKNVKEKNKNLNLDTFQKFVKFYYQELANKFKISSSYYIIYNNNIINNFMLFRAYKLDKILNLQLKGGSEQVDTTKKEVKPQTDYENTPVVTNINSQDMPGVQKEVDDKIKNIKNEILKTDEENIKNKNLEVLSNEQIAMKMLQGENQQMQKIFNFRVIMNNDFNNFGNLDATIYNLPNTLMIGRLNNLIKKIVRDSRYNVGTHKFMAPNYGNITLYRCKSRQIARQYDDTLTIENINKKFQTIGVTQSKRSAILRTSLSPLTKAQCDAENWGADETIDNGWAPSDTELGWNIDIYTDASTHPNFQKTPTFSNYINDLQYASRKNEEMYLTRHTYETNYLLNNKLLHLMIFLANGSGLNAFSMNWNLHVMKLLLYMNMYNVHKYIPHINQNTNRAVQHIGNEEYYDSIEDNIECCYLTFGDLIKYTRDIGSLPTNAIFIPVETNKLEDPILALYILSWLKYPMYRVRYPVYTVTPYDLGHRYEKCYLQNIANFYRIEGRDRFIIVVMDDMSETSTTQDEPIDCLGSQINQLSRAIIQPTFINNFIGAFGQLVESELDFHIAFVEFIKFYNVVFDPEIVDIVGRMTFRYYSELYLEPSTDNFPTYRTYQDANFPNFNGLGWIAYPKDKNYYQAVACYANSLQHIAYYRGLIQPISLESFKYIEVRFEDFRDLFDHALFAAYYDYVKMIDKGVNTFYLNLFEASRNSYNYNTFLAALNNSFNHNISSYIFRSINISMYSSNSANLADLEKKSMYLYHNYYDCLAFWKSDDLYKNSDDWPVDAESFPDKRYVDSNNNLLSFLTAYSTDENSLHKLEKSMNNVFRNMYRPALNFEIVNTDDGTTRDDRVMLFTTMNMDAITTAYIDMQMTIYTGRESHIDFIAANFYSNEAYINNYVRFPVPQVYIGSRFNYRITLIQDYLDVNKGYYSFNSNITFNFRNLTLFFGTSTNIDTDVKEFRSKFGGNNENESNNQ